MFLFLRDYLYKFNSDVHYIPTGVDTDFFKTKGEEAHDSRITFSWIGTAYHKEMGENIRFILEAFSFLAAKYDNIYLEIAGEGKYFYGIRNSLNNSRHSNRIKILDWIPPDEIPDYLSGIDIGLLPLIQDTKFNRAKSPTKLFEYMAMAKPAISSNIGEAAHIIKDGENGFIAKTKEEFTEKMQKLIEDADMRRGMGEKARQSVKDNYSLDVLGKRLYEILKTI